MAAALFPSPFFKSAVGRGADILIVDDPVSPGDAKNNHFNAMAVLAIGRDDRAAPQRQNLIDRRPDDATLGKA
jgi:hypothetical protein